MTQYSTEPEYSVEEKSERMHPSIAQSRDIKLRYMDQVVAELRLLSKELDISVDILGRIRDSEHALLQSLEDI